MGEVLGGGFRFGWRGYSLKYECDHFNGLNRRSRNCHMCNINTFLLWERGWRGVYLVRVALGLIFLSPIGGFGHNLSCTLIIEESEPSIPKFRKRASPLPAVLCVWGFKGAVLWATIVESRQVVFRAGVEPGNSKRKGDRPLHI